MPQRLVTSKYPNRNFQQPRQHQADTPYHLVKHPLGARSALSGHSPIHPRTDRDQTYYWRVYLNFLERTRNVIEPKVTLCSIRNRANEYQANKPSVSTWLWLSFFTGSSKILQDPRESKTVVHFLMTISWLFKDCLLAFSWLSHDFLIISSWLAYNFLMRFSCLSHDFFINFLMTFLWLYHYFLLTLSWLSHDYLATFSWLSHDLLMNFSWLSHDFFMIFPWFFLDFLWTFSRHSS